MYSVVTMNKMVIDEDKNIFIFVPNEIKSVELKNGKYIDKEGHIYTLISDKSICDKNKKMGVAFPIKNSDLLERCGNQYSLEECKDIRLGLIKEYMHIGFMMPTLDKVGIISKNKKTLYNKTLTINANSNQKDYVEYFDNEKPIVIDLTENETELLMSINELVEDLFKIDDLNEMYDSIEILSDTIYTMMDKSEDIKFNENSKEKGIVPVKSKRQLELEDAYNGFSEENMKARIKPYMDELNSLVGLESVKEEINKLINYIIYREKTKEFLEFEDLNLNMVFTGNPGTGKTTVAGIISKMLYELGYLNTDKTAYVTAEKLIAGYVGQTAIKTRELLDKNRGGVIVVDEAYVLASEANRFGPEAIAEILKDMEKRETAFIFAGYDREMKDFMNMNSGITSRLGIKMHFPDYEFEQLFQMLLNKVNKMSKSKEKKLHFSEDAKEKVIELIKNDLSHNDFGNARYINNLADTILRNKANTVNSATSIDELLTITVDDVPSIKKENDVKKKTIGFKK